MFNRKRTKEAPISPKNPIPFVKDEEIVLEEPLEKLLEEPLEKLLEEPLEGQDEDSELDEHSGDVLLSVAATDSVADISADDRVITVTYQGAPINLIRIKEKSDGKNASAYDGTYVRYAAYVYREKSIRISDYQETEIFFLKMFPQKKEMLVEGFCEALLGKIITKMIEQEFIDLFYKDCFSPAETVDIPDVGLALLQPFVISAAPLFQMSNESQERKSVTTEVTNRFLFGQGYERYLESISQPFHGLSYIIMIMLLFGNYSLHSGNVMVKLTEERADFKVIDYGAAFRNFMGTWQQEDIWQSLEEQNGLPIMWEYKKYLEYYKKIPGLFEDVLEHADCLIDLLKESQKLLVFQTLIMEAVEDTYELYRTFVLKNHGADYWITARTQLLQYIYGRQFDKFNEHIQDQLQIIAQSQVTHAVYIRTSREYNTVVEALFSKQVEIPVAKIIEQHLGHNMLEVIFSRLFTLTIRPPDFAACSKSDFKYGSARLSRGSLCSNSEKQGNVHTSSRTTSLVGSVSAGPEEESDVKESRRLSNPLVRLSSLSLMTTLFGPASMGSSAADVSYKKS